MSWDASLVVLFLLIGALVGWFAGWAARTDDNRRYAEAFRRRIETAELEAGRAWAEVDRLDAQLTAIPPAATTAPVINVHLTAPVVPSYRDLTGAAAAALAREMPVIEAAP
jgi:hypothetical protein